MMTATGTDNYPSSGKGSPCLGIIPARYASQRFPGKPLAPILGKPMFWHVWYRARQCPLFTDVVLATDDDRIYAAARELAVPVVMTRNDHTSGTDRVLEAAEQLNAPPHGIIVNIQGDEPALQPAMLNELIAPMQDAPLPVATLARIISAQEAQSRDQVKVIVDVTGRALYFSRAVIPFGRGDNTPRFFGHIGLYAYRMAALQQFVVLGPGKLEQIEKLEQLRLLENQIPIQVTLTRHVSYGVDRPEDLPRVIELLKTEQSPQA